MGVAQGWVLQRMTSDFAVRATASKVMPVVLVCQVFKALAYPMNGSLMGALDWSFSAVVLWCAGATAVGLYSFLTACGFGSGGGVPALIAMWMGLSSFFATQVAMGISR